MRLNEIDPQPCSTCIHCIVYNGTSIADPEHFSRDSGSVLSKNLDPDPSLWKFVSLADNFYKICVKRLPVPVPVLSSIFFPSQ